MIESVHILGCYFLQLIFSEDIVYIPERTILEISHCFEVKTMDLLVLQNSFMQKWQIGYELTFEDSYEQHDAVA